MAETRTKIPQAVVWILVIVAFLLLFMFQSLLRGLTDSYLGNLLIVGGATFGSTFILAFGTAILIGIFQVYQIIRVQLRYPVSLPLVLLRFEDLPPELAATIKNTAATLSPLGFGLIGCVKVAAPRTTFYLGLLHNPRAGTIARCALVVQNDHSEKVLAFQTRFSDGTECGTGHVSPAYFAQMVQAQPKGRTGKVFFDIEDPARLARLHQAGVEKHHSSPVDTGTIDPIRCQSEAIGREMATQLEAGYLRQEGDEYHTTRIGALKMALNICWPVFRLRTRAARRRAERFLAETGL